MIFELFLAISAGLVLLLGFIGCVLPIIPGPPLAWLGLLLGYFSDYCNIPTWVLVVTGIVSIIVTVSDYILPSFFTKKSGGSKSGSWGSNIGLIIGCFLGPFGIIICPFLGAFIGELINDSNDKKRALKAAWGAFVGFLFGTGIKLFVSAIFIWIFIASFF